SGQVHESRAPVPAPGQVRRSGLSNKSQARLRRTSFGGLRGNAATLVYMARRRFFVDTVERGHAQIAGEQAHHLTHVLRVGPGERFEISDNRQVYLAEVERVRTDLISFVIVEPVEIPAAVVHTT